MFRLVAGLVRRAVGRPDPASLKLAEAAASLQRELDGLRQDVASLATELAAVRERNEALLAGHRRALEERAALIELPAARPRSDRLAIEGAVRHRLRIARLAVGEPVALPFRRWMGETRCASTSADVTAVWQRLLSLEEAADDALRGEPAAVLDVPDAVVSKDGEGLRVSLGEDVRPGDRHGTVAVPKFTYDFPQRKVQNFGHFLLDCLPQVMAIAAVAPDATFLLPDTLKGFHRRVLALGGIADHQIRPWDGTPVAAARLLVQEGDGRIGRGRPHASFVALRRRLLDAAPPSGTGGGSRRIYVSRRDAKDLRQWLANQDAVEALFLSRGFEIVVMAECPLEEQIRIFREARVVAGISGAGLADVVFSPPGTHLVVLLSDSLVRWYASEAGARSGWMNGYAAGGDLNLAALGDSPRFYAHLAAACEQHCHSFVGGDEMPIEALAEFVDAVLRRADTAAGAAAEVKGA